MGTNITGIGNANAIGFKSLSSGGIYFPPELKDALVGVWSAYGKSNDSTDRNIIKNKIKDRGGDFVISNTAFKLNSGFGKYETELSNTRIWTQSKETTSSPFSSNYNGLSGWIVFANTELTNSVDMPSFKIQVKGLLEGQELIYRYYDSTGQTNVYSMTKDGKYTLPADVRTAKPLTSNTSGFQIVKNETNTITITQIPSFEGAFVTDEIDDLITSTKTVQEMGITDEVTVVSMIHQIDLNSTYNIATTNYIENSNSGEHVRSDVYNYGKTGIYGYSASLINNTKSDIKNILGDKADYCVKSTNKLRTIFNAKFSVVGRISKLTEASQLAWYWTFIANKVLTTDQINQVIAYFNLDRTLKPDILCNTIKQGITNENHAEFGDKLIDFSGNGRDIQLNNLAWDGDSGIGKYNYPNWKVTATIANTYSTIVNYPTVNGTYSINVNGVSELMQSIGLHLEIKYTTSTGIIYKDIKQDGVYSYILPDGATDLTLRFGGIPGIVNEPCNITITQIPSHAGALCLDGVNDFGKVTGLPIYKDYTVVADREIIDGLAENADGGVALKGSRYLTGAFCFDYKDAAFSFGTPKMIPLDTKRFISYQSKYVSNGISMNIGTATDNDELWIGRLGNDERYSKIAIRFLMSFPYSMSEFLIERQLKKHKLGTLYPDMVEFRPIIKANANYNIFYTALLPLTGNIWERINIGDYVPVGRRVAIQLSFDNEASELVSAISSQLGNISITKNSNNKGYTIFGDILKNKSPQKINITIDEYIRYENIVQPYPVLLRFNDENGNEVSWGGKFRVGSTITRIGSAADSNLLPNIYNIFGLLLNGNQVTSSKVIVEKTMVFKVKSAYIFDNNEPKCILSPRLLRIPNSSYKILGYIPDISGHGNHGVIHNSAYAEGSGVNEDGSYQLDGVDDFVTIPTLSSGGKQVLMKVNLPRLNEIIYDQRKETNTYTFAILTTPSQIAYDQSNSERITYIDGINTNIIAEQLMGVTHNIVVINSKANLDNTRSPILGRDINGNNWSRMRIYDFMLFESISTDDKIKELNEYVGIEGNTEWRKTE